MSDFHIHHAKFQDYSNRSTDWFIKSWKMKGIDKKIALLYIKKNKNKATKHLKLANKYLNE